MKKIIIMTLLLVNVIYAQSKMDFLKYDSGVLLSVKTRIQQNDKELLPSYNYLLELADEALEKNLVSVVDKPFTPPSGDKHDYMSLSPYWWPDPDKDDGLPWIRHDGKVNPEREKFDKPKMVALHESVTILGLAYYFTENEKYAKKASEFVKHWFVYEKTKMNPNLNYGQGVPGRRPGRGVGIIETKNLIDIIDGIEMFKDSKYWTEHNQKQMINWLSEFIGWLTTSELGIEESNRRNNHGSWYDVQTSYMAYYVGDIDLAKKIMGKFPEYRIAYQVESDGKQPLELERTRALSYSLFNLRAHFLAAKLGKKLGVDILNYTSKKGGSIKKEIEFLIPYVTGEKEWPYQQINKLDKAYFDMFQILRIATIEFQDDRFLDVISKMKKKQDKKSLVNLVYPQNH